MENVLEEIKVLHTLLETLNTDVDQSQSEVTLDNLQYLCAKWWDISKEFFGLNQLYTYDEDSLVPIGGLIWRSQILLVVSIGLVATITLLIRQEESGILQPARFELLI